MAIGKLPEADVEGSEEAIFAEINITPLTDIFLVLLIIVLVSSSVQQEQTREIVEAAIADKTSGLKVNLPSGEAQEIDPGSNSLVVSVLTNGEVVVNGTQVAEGDLDNIFRTAFAKDKLTQVILKADRGVDHGIVVGVMERAKRVGLSRLAIATKGG
ncbi:MAG: biopolymer transporter ExbD [Deltaproteobacteria bacterium]|jgi:biopolymer transport protein ExbD|nr:biopolymer transporter ExbD [Deltaproteobacteria bacterium]